MKLTKLEQKTVFDYNQQEPFVVCSTMDKALIRKLDRLCQKSKEISLCSDVDGARTYLFPKRWLKVKMPREISEEKRLEMAHTARQRFGFAKEGGDT